MSGNQETATGPWSTVEHEQFEQACVRFGWSNWVDVATEIPGRSSTQVKSHAQKFARRHPSGKRRLEGLHRASEKARRSKKKPKLASAAPKGRTKARKRSSAAKARRSKGNLPRRGTLARVANTTDTNPSLLDDTFLASSQLDEIEMKELLNHLERRDPALLRKAKFMISACHELNMEGHPQFGSLPNALGSILRLTVGETHWAAVCNLGERKRQNELCKTVSWEDE